MRQQQFGISKKSLDLYFVSVFVATLTMPRLLCKLFQYDKDKQSLFLTNQYYYVIIYLKLKGRNKALNKNEKK